MRTCGGTAHLTPTLYHAGMTGDLLNVMGQLQAEGEGPFVLAGFSLGGNVVLKLAGELGERADGITGVVAVSVPIDLAACARRLRGRDNFFYERRFVKRMVGRLLSTGRYKPEDFAGIGSIWDIDDRVTAPHFSFGRAEDYYRLQSAKSFLPSIRVPTQIVQAKDDTFIPFEIFDCDEIRSNPCIRLIATEQGGHIGYLSKRKPRFWIDEVIVEFAETQRIAMSNRATVDKTMATPIIRSATR
jgi:predicted alpha/beta-fold hydrolase